MQSVFITGTDTGVGKTIVSAALLAAARHAGVAALPMKPVQTGCTLRDGARVAPDLEICLQAAGLDPEPSTRELMAPYCFTTPCSPHLAAEEEGESISIERIVHGFHALIKATHPAVIVEGAGGVRVPIHATASMIDLMVALALPVLLVARPTLGTINHTLLSIEAIRSAGLDLLGVVFVSTAPSESELIERDNVSTIARLGCTEILGHVPYMAEFTGTSSGLPDLAHTANMYLGKLLERIALGENQGSAHRAP